jgi:DNA-binding NarL/FixJ family response regulator
MEGTTNKHPVRVLVADDHPLLREGIIAVLSNDSRFEVVGQAGDGREAIRQFLRYRPDVTLMDMQMPGIGGHEATAGIRAIAPRARIIVLTTYGDDFQALRAIRAGAAGYLLKNALRTDLIAAIAAVHAGERFIPADIAADLAARFDADEPTHRELEVLRSVAAGNSNKRVAQLLGIGEETVKAHMSNLLAKLRARDRTHAVAIAIRRNIIDP